MRLNFPRHNRVKREKEHTISAGQVFFLFTAEIQLLGENPTSPKHQNKF